MIRYILPAIISATVVFCKSTPGFIRYSDVAGSPYTVTYDKRALKINGEASLFVSGAIHPPRGTPDMWQSWFAEAKANSLNMIQVYIFWNYHEPQENVFDFSGRGNLTMFMQYAQEAGIFINLRIGPYVCAEWTYGGLPAWLGQKPGVAFRQTNSVWQPAMEKWFNHIVQLMAQGSFFATQGGPIVLVQVENELPATDIGYVNWCGAMAAEALEKVKVEVPITMCNGETANNTINTCNGNNCNSYLEQHGQNGRVLVDQPGLWTENEGGFQTWGAAPPPGKEPYYFWGRSMQDTANAVLGWFARGGSHMNYYMWTGGNNYGRWTGDSITHMYAVDAILCPDGLRHEPKFSYTTAMHSALAQAAGDVASNPAQLNKAAKWEVDGSLLLHMDAYVYGDYAFVENLNAKTASTSTQKGKTFTISANSAALVNLKTGATLFDSGNPTGSHATGAPTTARVVQRAAPLSNWTTWAEPIQAASVKPGQYPSSSLFYSAEPMEMTNITSALTTFAFYETTLEGCLPNTLSIPTVNAQAFVAFVDGKKVGDVYDASHGSGSQKILTIDLSTAAAAAAAAAPVEGEDANMPRKVQTLTLLAEELGYANYGFKTELYKGIVTAWGKNINVAGPWKMRGGLAGEHLKVWTTAGSRSVTWTPAAPTAPLLTAGTWYQTSFQTPAELSASADAKLLLHAQGLTRGRFWVNEHEVGRYWTLARNDASACPDGAASCPTQQYYHIPTAWLSTSKTNTLTIFETVGAASMPLAELSVSKITDHAGEWPSLTSVTSCEF